MSFFRLLPVLFRTPRRFTRYLAVETTCSGVEQFPSTYGHKTTAAVPRHDKFLSKISARYRWYLTTVDGFITRKSQNVGLVRIPSK